MNSTLIAQQLRLGLLSAGLCLSQSTFAQQSWPGESWENATALGSLRSEFSNGDISGAHWNDDTQTLWVTDNKEESIWSLVRNGNSFSVDKSFDASGDLEGITQTSDNSVIFVMNEESDRIQSYNTSNGSSIQSWDLSDDLPSHGSDDKDGPEGITFVPNEWLTASGFRDNSGSLYSQSQYDFGGLFFVAHQNGGGVYVFDLNNSGSYTFVGEYDTSADESSGLAFDSSTGKLYISHNTDGNTLEISDLSSSSSSGHRKFSNTSQFKAPNGSNLEGFAISPARASDGSAQETWVFYADDDGNTDDGNAILWFTDLDPSINVAEGNNQKAEANQSLANPVVIGISDAFGNALQDIDVNFSVSNGGGSLSNSSDASDDQGRATLNQWTLGNSGSQSVSASIDSNTTVTVNATIEDDEPPVTNTDIIASSSTDDGNVAANVLDDNLNTRWSANGEHWLELDLREAKSIQSIDIAFFKGNQRRAIFDLSTSTDGSIWTKHFSDTESTGNSLSKQSFTLSSPVNAQYIRYDGHGNSSSSWNSITEMSVTEGDDLPNLANIPGKIQAEDYTSFDDSTNGNAGNTYRDDDVDIQSTSDSSGSYDIFNITDNEWLEYDVVATQPMNYTAKVRVAAASSTGEVQFSLAGSNVGSALEVQSTGSWNNWTTLEVDLGFISSGTHTIRVNVNNAGFRVNWIELFETPEIIVEQPQQIVGLNVHSASSTTQSSNDASNLFDDNTNNSNGARWSAFDLSNTTQTVVLDLGTNYFITSTTLLPFKGRDYQYTIELSENPDSGYSTIVDRSNNSEGGTSLTDQVSNITNGRYLRLNVLGADSYTGDWSSINELVLMGVQ